MAMSIGSVSAPVDMVALMGKYTKVHHRELLGEDLDRRTVSLHRGRLLYESLDAALTRAQALFTRIEKDLEVSNSEPFFLAKAGKVWKTIQRDPMSVELLEDLKLLAAAVNESFYNLSFEQRNSLAEVHQRVVAGKVYLYWMSHELHGHIEEIARTHKEGGDQDSKLAKEVCVLLMNWTQYLSYFPNRCLGEEFLSRFAYATSPLSVKGARLIERLYYHVWSLAVKDGMKVEGDHWGQEHALDDIFRLQQAVKALRKEIQECNVTQSLEKIAAGSGAHAKHLAQALAEWVTYLESYPAKEDNAGLFALIQEQTAVFIEDNTPYERICFHVWDLATKAGVDTRGDDWGEVHLFDDSKRLSDAINKVKDELLSLEMAPQLEKIKKGVKEGRVDVASHAGVLASIIRRLQEYAEYNPAFPSTVLTQLGEVVKGLHHEGKPLSHLLMPDPSTTKVSATSTVLSPSSRLAGMLGVVTSIVKPRSDSVGDDPKDYLTSSV